MDIRWVKERDYEQIMTLENEVWNDTNTPMITTYQSAEEFAQSLEYRKVAVAVEDATVLGFIDAFQVYRGINTNFSLAVGMAVSPSARRKGVASQLLKWIIHYAEGGNYNKISLRVLATNPAAVAFYKKSGFVVEGVLKHEFFLNNQWADDIVDFCQEYGHNKWKPCSDLNRIDVSI